MVRPLVDPLLAVVLDDLVALAPFGAKVEVALLVNGTVVVGTPIAERDYFRQLGERFQKAVEAVSATPHWKRSYDERREYDRGWDDATIAGLGRARERGLELFGELAQDQVRQRVLARPHDLPYWRIVDDELKRYQERFDKLFGEGADASREFIHLSEVTISGAGFELSRTTPWRCRLIDVSAWSIAPTGTIDREVQS